MNAKAEQLYQEALDLPQNERVALAERLLDTASDEPLPTGDDLRGLQEVIDAGRRDVAAGRVVPAEDVLCELDTL
jgi:hypothetical protein